MSIKKLLGIDHDHISDEEIVEKIREAKKQDKDHIEITDPEGNTIKIDIPDMDLDPELMYTKYD
ncbi:hypothetical protein GF361_05200 [Candidatus Woesearchaeota archaeon]|nr:hypothetical protein [Candidatus Woesearchaeota archaeon]